jgi:hypothetical protein
MHIHADIPKLKVIPKPRKVPKKPLHLKMMYGISRLNTYMRNFMAEFTTKRNE